MSKVYVLNKNAHPLKEIFKGEEMEIAANDYWRDKKGEKRIFDIFEANDFRGQYRPVPFDGSGKMINDPRYFKMVELVPVDGAPKQEEKVEPTGFKCMALGCKHVSPSPEELEAHTNVRHAGLERLILPEQDAEIKRTKKKHEDHAGA